MDKVQNPINSEEISVFRTNYLVAKRNKKGLVIKYDF
jgi:hypothetical protein